MGWSLFWNHSITNDSDAENVCNEYEYVCFKAEVVAVH